MSTTATFSFGDIEVVSFDIWKTIFKSNPAYSPHRSRAIGETLLPGVRFKFERVDKIVKRVKDETDEMTRGDGKQYGFRDRINLVWKYLGPRGRVKVITEEMYEKLEQQLSGFMAEMPPFLNEPEIPFVIETLKKRGYKIALMSNTGFIDGVHMRVALNHYGILGHVNFVYFSNEVGLAKPNPQIFQRLLQDTKVEACEALHVGDDVKTDYYGALDSGLRALHLSTDPNVESEKIASLTELLDLLPQK